MTADPPATAAACPAFIDGACRQAGWRCSTCPRPTASPTSSASSEPTTAATDDFVVINRDERGKVHGCPPEGSSLTPCCQRTPFELPKYDRLTIDPKQVTCGE